MRIKSKVRHDPNKNHAKRNKNKKTKIQHQTLNASAEIGSTAVKMGKHEYEDTS